MCVISWIIQFVYMYHNLPLSFMCLNRKGIIIRLICQIRKTHQSFWIWSRKVYSTYGVCGPQHRHWLSCLESRKLFSRPSCCLRPLLGISWSVPHRTPSTNWLFRHLKGERHQNPSFSRWMLGLAFHWSLLR